MRGALLLIFTACAADPEPHPDAACGDGARDEFELCDDGNTIDGDGCSSKCALEPLATVYWHLHDTFPSAGQGEVCRPGVETVELVNETNMARSFPCAAASGSLHVRSGDRLLARLRAGDGAIVAESLPMRPNIMATLSIDFYEHAGYVRIWIASDVCPPGTAEVWLTPLGGGTPFYNGTSCTQTPLVSIAPAGTYDVTIKTPRLEHTITGVTVLPNNAVTDVELR